MDALHMQAMLVRRDAAVKLLDHYDEEGRLELLAFIIDPPEAIMIASLQMAREKGPTKLAYEMAVRAASEKAREAARSY